MKTLTLNFFVILSTLFLFQSQLLVQGSGFEEKMVNIRIYWLMN